MNRRVLVLLISLLVVGWSLFPPIVQEAQAAIAKAGTDTSHTDWGAISSTSFSHTLVAGSSRMVVVSIGVENDGDYDVDGVTYGGVTMNKAIDAATGTSGYIYLADIWYILEADLPGNGSQTVAITLSAAGSIDMEINAFCAEYTGVNQGVPEATDGSTTTSSPISNTISPSASAWVISAVGTGHGADAPGTYSHGEGQVSVYDFEDASSHFAVAELRGASGETSLSTSRTGTVNRMARVAASWTENESPGAPTLYNVDSVQLCFNNAKINDDTPTFRVAATDPNSDPVDYRIEIDDDPAFGSIDWTIDFDNGGSHYTSGSQVNLTCTTLTGISDGTTYYVQVKAKDPDGSNTYGSYSSGTWSFTYNATAEDPMWFQITDEQFDTGTLSGTETYGSDQVRITQWNAIQYAETEAESSTISTFYQDKTTLTFTPESQSDYLIVATAELKGDRDDYSMYARLTIDGATHGYLQAEPDEANIYIHHFATHRIVNLTAASHTIRIQYCSDDVPFGSMTTYIRRARIVAIPLGSFESNESEDWTTLTSTSYTDIVSETFTPSSAGDYLLIASAQYVVSSNAESIYIQSLIDSTNVGELISEAQDAGDDLHYFTVKIESLDTTSHTIKIQARNESTAQHMIRRARVAAIPLSANGLAQENAATETYTTNGTTTPSDITTLTFTPSAQADYYFLTSALIGGDAGNGSGYNTYSDFDADGTETNYEQKGFQDYTDRLMFGATKKINLTAASHTFKLRLWSGSLADPDGGMGNARIIALTKDDSGTITSPVIDFDSVIGGADWNQLLFTDDETNGDIRYDVQYWDGDSWENTSITNQDSSPVDMSGLDPATHNEVRIKATLTDSGGTPYLEDWTVTWTPSESPTAPTLYDTGGAEQLCFNNAKINDDTPTFRVAATDPEGDPVDYRIEIDDDANFGSIDWTRDFDNGGSHYTSGSQVNLTCTTLTGISDGTTYYVQVKAKDPDGSTSYGPYSSGTWSFTYNAASEDPMWFQTTDEQFDTGTLSATETDPPNDRVKVSSGWLSGWDQRIKLTIDSAGSKVDADLSDFPILVYLSTSSGITNADVSCVFDELGSDANRKKIAITKSDATSECYVEIEKWDHASEKAWLWVKVSGTNSISSSADTELYLYYDVDHADNTTYVGDSGSRTEVWDANHVGVWHLKETSGTHYDSTQSGNNGTPSVTTQGSATGRIDGADDFDDTNTDYVTLGNSGMLVAEGTVSLWANMDSSTGTRSYIFSHRTGTNNNRCYLYEESGTLYVGFADVFSNNIGYTIPPDTWRYYTLKWTGAAWTVYVNGNPEGSGSSNPMSGIDNNTHLGSYLASQEWFDGILDELRVSNISRSAAWIEASYYSGDDSLITFGSVETSPVSTITSPAIDFDSVTSAQAWDELSWNDSEPGSSDIKYRLKYRDSDWLSGWDKRIKLTIDSAGDKVDADLSDFPILVYLSTSSGITNADVSCVFDELGSDANRKKIAVTKSDATSECYVEIEKWDHASEKAWLWVKVSGTNSISSSSDTDLYLYYDADHVDNTTYVDDSSSRTEVWDDGGSNYYEGVWHLSETDIDGGSGDIKDSTGNGNDGTTINMEAADSVSGQIGSGFNLDEIAFAEEAVNLGDINAVDGASDLTVSAWVRFDKLTADNCIVSKGNFAANEALLLWRDELVGAGPESDTIGVQAGNGSTGTLGRTGNGDMNDSNWHHVVYTFDGGSATGLNAYVDGVQANTSTPRPLPGDVSSVNTLNDEGVTPVYIGRSNGGSPYMDGVVDEVRISTTARSAAWIEADFNSGNDSLITYGSEETSSAGSWVYIPDGDLSGNSSGFDDSPVNLSALNTSTYNELKIEATFTEGSSPILDDWTISWVGPTLVELVSFSAVGHFNKVVVHWETGSEYNNAGFNLYVSEQEGGPYERLNASLIPGKGTSSTGEAYSYVDYNVTTGSTYYYRLEDVEYSGTKTMYGPVMARPGLDTDQDGMTDDWEIYYGLDPYTDDAQGDLDGDGYPNLEEFLLGEDPTQDNSVPVYGMQPAESQADGVRIISSDESGITIELITTGFETIPKEIDGITFQLLEIPGYDHGYTTEPGRPKLPVKSVLLAIPEGASCSIEDLDYDVVDLYGYNIYPVTGTVDTDFYATNRLYPSDIAEVSRVGSMRDQRVAAVNFNPLLFNPATSELRFYERIRVRLSFEDVEHAPSRPGKPIVLPGDEKLKIYTSKEGLYRIEWDQISDQLLNLGYTDPRTIKVYFKGEEIPIRVKGEEDGSFDSDDYIEFYALANNSKYSSTNVYWLTYEGDDGKRMEDILSSDDSPVDTPDRFNCVKHVEKNDFYWGERTGDDGVDRWFWTSYIWGGGHQDYEIDLKDLNPSYVEDEARVKISCYALFDVGHHTLTYINGELIDDALWDGEGEHIVDVMVPQNDLFDGQNTITMEAKLDTGEDYDLILPNYFEIAYYKNFAADEDLLDFSHSSGDGVSQFDISGFSNEDLELFDITEPDAVKYITGFEVIEESGAYSMSFKDLLTADEGKTYLALAHNKANSPDVLKLDTPSNLRSETNTSDYLIITHSDFKESLMPLRNLYEDKLMSAERYMRVKLIDIEDIYDEFNYGIKSPHAIKDFLTYAYTEWSPPHPTYVLLVGDATYDYKDYLGYGNTDYVPTYLLPNTPYFGETASDNWFVCLDGADDILPDMFIGRIPASTAQEVADVVGKILEYDAIPSTDWSKEILLLADDEQPFEDTCESLTAYVPEELGVTKHYLGDYSNYSLFAGDIIGGIDDGALVVNYMGHGSTDLWTEEALFNTNTIDTLNNQGRYPFVTTFTCIDGYYLHPYEYSSMAEVFLMRPQGGAIACWSPTGMGMPQGHNILSQELFKAMFIDGKRGLGAATTQAKLELFSKSATSHEDLIHTYILFGDPALSLNMGAEDALPEGFESIYESTILNYDQPWDWDDANRRADADGGSSNGSGSGRCFIATAVFGSSEHPHVKALRDVRDRYLITNAPGRWLVSVYYSYGPSWADFLNAHPSCKPAVRLAIMPLVGISYLLVKTSLLAKLLTGLLLLGFVVCVLSQIHGRSRSLTP